MELIDNLFKIVGDNIIPRNTKNISVYLHQHPLCIKYRTNRIKFLPSNATNYGSTEDLDFSKVPHLPTPFV